MDSMYDSFKRFEITGKIIANAKLTYMYFILLNYYPFYE